MTTTYTNPRLHAEIDNWPMGGSRRGTAIFSVEAKPGKGERGVRITRRDGEKPSTPKTLTFARKVRIVDGDDGKTYIAELSGYGHVSVMQSNMQFQAESVHEGDPRHASLLALFK
jgi:hypothetical protein